MTAPSILAIDGGGSKTLVALADDAGNLTRLVRGDGINPMESPHWRDDFAALITAFDRGSAHIVGIVAALPAYGEVAAVSAAQRDAVATLFGPTPSRIVNDVDAAHFGAFAGGPGILILSGSGSMAWARDKNGNAFRVGGWGESIGDEGSAHWIGLRTVTLVSHGLDGRAELPGLVDGLIRFLDLDRSDPHDSLLGWFGGLSQPRAQIAALAPLVDRLAQQGDPAALAIIDEAAGHLALHVAAIARRVGGAKLDWSYAGGAFQSHLLLDILIGKIGRPPQAPMLPPIGGALLFAAKDLDWPVDEAWIGRLAASIQSNAIFAPEQPLANVKQGEQGHAWKNRKTDTRTGGARLGHSGSGR